MAIGEIAHEVNGSLSHQGLTGGPRFTDGLAALEPPAFSASDGNGGEKLDREFMQQTSRLLKRKAAINH